MRTKLWTVYSRLSAEMRLLWPSRTKLLKSMKHSRKEELPKEDARMLYMTRQKRKLEAQWGNESKASESTAELRAGGEVLRAGSTHWELVVSLFHPLWDYQCFALLVWFFVVWGGSCCFCLVTGFPPFSIWCTRSSFIPRLSPSSWWAQHRSKKK